MENSDKELILRISQSDAQLRRLYQEHLLLEDLLDKYTRKGFLTAEEELEEKILKKKKLFGVDRMMSLLEMYKSGSVEVEELQSAAAG